MDNLSEMAVFARVVEARSFTGAARDLGLSKSAVSKQVRRLEDRLGARLLNRTTRKIGLTDVGQAFYDRCARILAEVEEAELAVSQLQSTPRGTLRLSVPMSLGHAYIAPAVAAFQLRHPELSVEMTLNDRVVDLIDEGFDLAVRVGQLADSRLIARRLAPVERIIVASEAYLAEHGEPAHPSELSDHDCLIYSYVSDAWPFEGPDGEKVKVRVSGRFRANNGDAIVHAAEAGLGIAAMPLFICGPSLCAGRVRRIFADWTSPMGGIYAVYPHSRHLSAKVRLLVDFLAERFAGEAPWKPAVDCA